jgi:hypothetical protein
MAEKPGQKSSKAEMSTKENSAQLGLLTVGVGAKGGQR